MKTLIDTLTALVKREDRIEFLEKALDQAIEHGSFSIPKDVDFVDIPSHVKWDTPGAVMTGDEITSYVVLPELAQYLKEKKEQWKH